MFRSLIRPSEEPWGRIVVEVGGCDEAACHGVPGPGGGGARRGGMGGRRGGADGDGADEHAADAAPAAADVGVRVARARGALRRGSRRGRARCAGGAGRRRSETGCPANRGSNVRVNQNCLNLTDPDLQGRGQAQNETAIAQDPNNPSAHRRVAERLPPRRRQLLRVVLAATTARTWTDSTPPMGFTRGDRVRRRRAPVLAGRRRHVGGLGHEGQRLPVLPDVQPRRSRVATTRTSRARSTSSARPATAARRGTSRRARSPSSTTRPAAGDGAARQAAHDGRRPPRAARSRTAST